MKTETRELLGFTVPVVGMVETLQEAISAAGGEQNVLNDYLNNVLAHSHYSVLRREIVKQLEKLTGIKRKTVKEGEGDKAKDVIAEKDGQYIARLETELGEDAVKSFESAIADACGKIPVDYSVGTRGSATPAKKWLAAVDDLITAGKFEKFLAKVGIEGDPTDESTKVAAANKIKDLVAEKAAEAMRAAVSIGE